MWWKSNEIFSDHTTDATYDTEILKLTSHATQRRSSTFYSNVNVKEAIRMETDKKIYWTGTTQYIKVTVNQLQLIVMIILTYMLTHYISFTCGSDLLLEILMLEVV